MNIAEFVGPNAARRLIFAIVLFLSALSRAEEAAKPQTIRLFTIGNSFSHNATHYVRDIAKADGNTIVLNEAIIGGASMLVHWEKAQLHEKEPQNPKGIYYRNMGLKEILASEKWDVVTIQQASLLSHDLSSYQPYATNLRDYVAKYAPGAKLLIHETWEYRVDDPRFSKTTRTAGEPASQQAMYDGLSAAYRAVSSELHVGLIPTGDAFHLADNDPKWAFHPDTSWDSKKAKNPELPVQTHSLHVGWTWAKPKNGGDAQLRMDGHHANMAGEYLGACVWYETLFGKSVVGNSFVPKGLDPADAKFLQGTAHRAVENYKTKVQ